MAEPPPLPGAEEAPDSCTALWALPCSFQCHAGRTYSVQVFGYAYGSAYCYPPGTAGCSSPNGLDLSLRCSASDTSRDTTLGYCSLGALSLAGSATCSG